MVKSFTKEEKEKIDSLYRNDGWPIKKVARHLGVSDKRVSAYLKGEMEEKPLDSCGKDECLKEEVTKGEFLSCIKGMIKTHADSCYKFVDAVYTVILEEVLEVLTEKKLSKKVVTKRCNERLDRLFKATMDVTYAAGCAAIFTMPQRYKKAWADNVLTDPLRCLKESLNKKSSNGKK